jgi:hypothetical protein
MTDENGDGAAGARRSGRTPEGADPVPPIVDVGASVRWHIGANWWSICRTIPASPGC